MKKRTSKEISCALLLLHILSWILFACTFLDSIPWDKMESIYDEKPAYTQPVGGPEYLYRHKSNLKEEERSRR